MNKLVIVSLCLAAVCMVRAQYGHHGGYPYNGASHGAPVPVADTPEVAAAKAAHFAAYNAAASAAAGGPAPAYHGAHAYNGAPAYPGAYAGASSYNGAPGYPGAAPAYGGHYGGVPAVPADTPEVAAAKAAHFAAHAQASGQHYG